MERAAPGYIVIEKMLFAVNETNVFSYICGEYTLKNIRNTINDYLERVSFSCLKVVPVSSEISDLRNSSLHAMCACKE